jgi:hypothetical protein
VNEEVGRIEQGWIQLARSEQFLGIFSKQKTCDPGQANQNLLCELHSRKIIKNSSSGFSFGGKVSTFFTGWPKKSVNI